MPRLIDADALLEKLSRMIDYCKNDNKVSGLTALFQVGDAIIDCPTVDAVSRGVHEQVRWERDVVIEQLESYGVSLGEKADVVKVVHGRWVRCKDWDYDYECSVCEGYAGEDIYGYYNKLTPYCPNCGADMRERKDNEN